MIPVLPTVMAMRDGKYALAGMSFVGDILLFAPYIRMMAAEARLLALRQFALREQQRVISLMRETYSAKKLREFTTVVAVVDKDTGKVIVKAKCTPKYRGQEICAEDLAVKAFGGKGPSLEISPAIRPGSNSVVPACRRCQQN